jgi:hypothetical protein
MKPLFVLLFSMLSVTVVADQYVSAPIWYSAVPVSTVPINERVTIYEMPQPYVVSSSIVTTVPETVWTHESVVLPDTALPHTVAKATEKPSLGPLMPLQDNLPVEPEEKAVEKIVLGQVSIENELDAILKTAPPIPRGAVEERTIDSKLTENASSPSSEDIFIPQQINTPAGSVSKSTDHLGDGALLAVTVFAALGFFYMAFLAYDYHQRWMQSLTMQNDRYLGNGAFDREMEDVYSGSSGSGTFTDNFGLPRRSSV